MKNDNKNNEEINSIIKKGRKDQVVDDKLSPLKGNKTLRTLRVSILGTY
jgi:hypothetical protein